MAKVLDAGSAPQPRHVAVIGAGIVGCCTALALLGAGHRVTLIDPAQPGAEQAASYGNGAFISPASIIPMSMPGIWRKVPSYLADPLGPLTIRWRNLPTLAPWLVRFLRAGWTEARVRRTASLLNGLLADAPARHAAIAQAVGRPDLIRQDGLIYAYRSRADFEAEALSWRLRRENGLQWRELEAEALHELEPALAPHYRFAVLVNGAHCIDPGGYVAALVDAVLARGAQTHRAEVLGFTLRNGRLTGLRTDKGEVACDTAVIAAGIRSAGLAAQLGDAVPLVSERGYHVELPGATGGPSRPVMPGDGKMANSPLHAGLRAAGQVELASTDAAPDWRRADVLLAALRRTYPGLSFDETRLRRWQGHRPSTPDGLPVIGVAAKCPDVIHAFGHGHVGLASAPATAEIVVELLQGAARGAEPFSPRRFRQW